MLNTGHILPILRLIELHLFFPSSGLMSYKVLQQNISKQTMIIWKKLVNKCKSIWNQYNYSKLVLHNIITFCYYKVCFHIFLEINSMVFQYRFWQVQQCWGKEIYKIRLFSFLFKKIPMNWFLFILITNALIAKEFSTLLKLIFWQELPITVLIQDQMISNFCTLSSL